MLTAMCTRPTTQPPQKRTRLPQSWQAETKRKQRIPQQRPQHLKPMASFYQNLLSVYNISELSGSGLE
jgi:hypothetical protein